MKNVVLIFLLVSLLELSVCDVVCCLKRRKIIILTTKVYSFDERDNSCVLIDYSSSTHIWTKNDFVFPAIFGFGQIKLFDPTLTGRAPRILIVGEGQKF